MEYLSLIGTITLVHLLAVISPGPDFVILVKNTLSYSRRAGLFTSIGFGIGVLVHIAYCVAGLALIISKSALLFTIIKFLGATYLIVVGIKSFFSKPASIATKTYTEKNDISPLVALRSGFLTNALNPKATLFFLSLFTFAISPDIPNTILVIISIILVINTILWFSFLTLFLSQKRVRKLFDKYQIYLTRTLGGVLVGLGIKLALMQK